MDVRTISRWMTAAFIAVLVCGCSENPLWGERDDGTTDAPPHCIVVPDLSEDIIFAFGQTVFIESDDLTITFSDVLCDSRCPIDAYCFWPGQAEIELAFRTADDRHDVAVLMIQPGRIPYEGPELYECCLGYRVYLLWLDPYPTSGGEIREEEYVAWIRVVPDDECCQDGPM
jgi:hypothetical protein